MHNIINIADECMLALRVLVQVGCLTFSLYALVNNCVINQSPHPQRSGSPPVYACGSSGRPVYSCRDGVYHESVGSEPRTACALTTAH